MSFSLRIFLKYSLFVVKDYRKRARTGFSNVRKLADNSVEGPQNASFLQLEWEFQRYILNILRLCEVSGKIMEVKPNSSKSEFGVELLLPTTARHALLTSGTISDKHDNFTVLYTNEDFPYKEEMGFL